MKAHKVDEPQPSKDRKQRHDGQRPKRVGEHGPIGFGSVMRDVNGPPSPAATVATQLQAGQMSAATEVLMSMGAVPTSEQLVIDMAQNGPQRISPGSSDALLQVNAQQHTLPTQHLGRMTPQALLTKVVDEATKLEIEKASKELHVELEPAHLGPLVVSLRRDEEGRLDVRFRARRADAASVLDAGSDLLRARLAEAGFTTLNIAVDHDESLELDAR